MGQWKKEVKIFPSPISIPRPSVPGLPCPTSVEVWEPVDFSTECQFPSALLLAPLASFLFLEATFLS